MVRSIGASRIIADNLGTVSGQDVTFQSSFKYCFFSYILQLIRQSIPCEGPLTAETILGNSRPTNRDSYVEGVSIIAA